MSPIRKQGSGDITQRDDNEGEQSSAGLRAQAVRETPAAAPGDHVWSAQDEAALREEDADAGPRE